MHRSVVVLPHPLGPRRVMNSRAADVEAEAVDDPVRSKPFGDPGERQQMMISILLHGDLPDHPWPALRRPHVIQVAQLWAGAGSRTSLDIVRWQKHHKPFTPPTMFSGRMYLCIKANKITDGMMIRTEIALAISWGSLVHFEVGLDSQRDGPGAVCEQGERKLVQRCDEGEEHETRMPGDDSGRTTYHNICFVDAPQTRAASSSRSSRPSNVADIINMTSGTTRMECARAIPTCMSTSPSR